MASIQLSQQTKKRYYNIILAVSNQQPLMQRDCKIHTPFQMYFVLILNYEWGIGHLEHKNRSVWI